MVTYKVIDLHTRAIVKESISRKLAYRYAHKKDNEYGAVRFAVLFEQESDKELTGDSEGGNQ